MSTSKIDRSLDEIIKENKDSRKKGKFARKPGQRQDRRPGRRIGKPLKRRFESRGPRSQRRDYPGKRFSERKFEKRHSRPFKARKIIHIHDKVAKSHTPPKEEKLEDKTRLWVENLPPNVTNADLQVFLYKSHHNSYYLEVLDH